MITEFADEYSLLLTTDYFNAERRNLQQMTKCRKESDRGDSEIGLKICCSYNVMYIACVMPLQNRTS